MLKQKIKFLAILIAFGLSSKAQISQYKYQRPLQKVNNNWHSLTLPNSLFKQVQNGLEDIRIYGIKGKDTIEVPYILEQSANQITERESLFKIINQSNNPNGYYYTFHTENQSIINQIRLSFKQVNFNWKVTLAGSNNNQEWFTILTDYRILAIKNESTDYHFTQLNFPNSKYTYYRILINADEQPELNAAKTLKVDTLKGTDTIIPIQSYHVTNDAKSKQSKIEVNLGNPSPVSALMLMVQSDFDFYRPLNIEYATDSFKTDKGIQYNYAQLYNGTISSLENSEFRFNSVITNRLRITITNADNKPLHLNKLILKGPIYELIARFDQLDYQYALYYGNQNVTAPSYELKNFENKIPISVTAVNVGEEKNNPFFTKKITAPPLFENKMWLWAIMAIIIGLLAFFAYKMLK